MHTQRTAWNEAAAAYNSLHEGDLSFVRLGQQEILARLGDVAGLTILEIGCGSGQCCVALARQGAEVTGVDVSDAQLALAQKQAAAAGVPVRLLLGDGGALPPLSAAHFDAIIANFSLLYIEDITACLAECARLLRPGGRLIFAQDHPIRACFWDAEMEEESVLPARSYFDEAPLHWTFTNTEVAMISHHHTLAWWFSSLHEAGLQVTALRELPQPAGWADDPNADEYTRDIAVFLPQVMVIEAQKL